MTTLETLQTKDTGFPSTEMLGVRHENENTSCRRAFDTPLGRVFLQDACPPELVAQLRADDGLRAFARLPEREHQLLLNIAQLPDASLTLAYTATGEIVGQVTRVPADSWWREQEPIYEVAVEVSARWRQHGVARQLLTLALERDSLEQAILVGLGLSWHWDTEGMGIAPMRYRLLIAQLFAPYGFMEYMTTEPNIMMSPANILLVRIGGSVEQKVLNQFLNRLFQPEKDARFFI